MARFEPIGHGHDRSNERGCRQPVAARDTSASTGTRRTVIALVMFGAVCFVAAIPFLTDNTYRLNVLILIFLLAVMASGWNIMAGYAGYISLGQSAFMGVGAYTAGILAARWDVSPFLVAPLGGIAAAIVAFLLGLATSAHAWARLCDRVVRNAGVARARRQELVVGDRREPGLSHAAAHMGRQPAQLALLLRVVDARRVQRRHDGLDQAFEVRPRSVRHPR